MPYRSYIKDTGRWFDLFNQLAAANISYQLVLAGDDLVEHPLTPELLGACPLLLIPERNDFLPADKRLVDEYAANHQVYDSVPEIMSVVKPVVQVKVNSAVRALPRVATGSAVVHLLNYAYDAAQDDVTQLTDVAVRVDLPLLGVGEATTCQLLAPDFPPQTLHVDRGTVLVPKLGLWGVLVF